MAQSMNVRRLPRYQIVAKLRKRGVFQKEIARRAGVDTSYVSKILGREQAGTPGAEKVWQEVERALQSRTA